MTTPKRERELKVELGRCENEDENGLLLLADADAENEAGCALPLALVGRLKYVLLAEGASKRGDLASS